MIAAALPSDRKSMAKISKRLEGMDMTCGPDEILVLIDTGSFTHAINADTHLPKHKILPVPKSEAHKVAETACGGTLKMLGKVRTQGTVGNTRIAMTWSHMEVQCPILSVRCLIDDGHDVWIKKGGGIIRNLESKKEITFHEHAGVYYCKMRLDQPIDDSKSDTGDTSLFIRRGA